MQSPQCARICNISLHLEYVLSMQRDITALTPSSTGNLCFLFTYKLCTSTQYLRTKQDVETMYHTDTQGKNKALCAARLEWIKQSPMPRRLHMYNNHDHAYSRCTHTFGTVLLEAISLKGQTDTATQSM